MSARLARAASQRSLLASAVLVAVARSTARGRRTGVPPADAGPSTGSPASSRPTTAMLTVSFGDGRRSPTTGLTIDAILAELAGGHGDARGRRRRRSTRSTPPRLDYVTGGFDLPGRPGGQRHGEDAAAPGGPRRGPRSDASTSRPTSGRSWPPTATRSGASTTPTCRASATTRNGLGQALAVLALDRTADGRAGRRRRLPARPAVLRRQLPPLLLRLRHELRPLRDRGGSHLHRSGATATSTPPRCALRRSSPCHRRPRWRQASTTPSSSWSARSSPSGGFVGRVPATPTARAGGRGPARAAGEVADADRRRPSSPDSSSTHVRRLRRRGLRRSGVRAPAIGGQIRRPMDPRAPRRACWRSGSRATATSASSRRIPPARPGDLSDADRSRREPVASLSATSVAAG